MKYIKSFYYSRISFIINCLSNFINLVNITRISKEANSELVVAFTFYDFNHGRYAYQMLKYFNEAGFYLVPIKCNKFLINLHLYDRLIWKLSGLRGVSKNQQFRPKYWLTYNFDTSLSLNYDKRIKLNPNIYSGIVESHIKLPFFWHPLVTKIPVTSKKNARILFYGQNDLAYSSDWIIDFFKLTPRNEIYKKLSGGMSFQTLVLESHEDLKTLDNNYCNALCILDSSKLWLSIDTWLKFLSQFDFFIAAPGISIPHSHNLIEAMAVRTIPVLEYGNMFSPPLKDGENSIYFKGLDDLVKKIELILNMSQSEIALLRANLNSYYQSYVDPNSLPEKLDSIKEEPIIALFSAEEISLQCLKKP